MTTRFDIARVIPVYKFALPMQCHPLSTANSGIRATLGVALNSMWKDSETNIDYLNFNYLVEVITELVTDNDITPSTIGVYGDWEAASQV